MYSVLLSDCTTTTYILLPSLECQGRDCLSRLYLDCGYCLARLQKDITVLHQPTNEIDGYYNGFGNTNWTYRNHFSNVRESLKKEIDHIRYICVSSKSTPVSSFAKFFYAPAVPNLNIAAPKIVFSYDY
jgi:hypothetical protein